MAWLVAPLTEAQRLPVLQGRTTLAQGDAHGLWRVDRREALSAGTLSCPGMPNGG
jgi:hypothetical protein